MKRIILFIFLFVLFASSAFSTDGSNINGGWTILNNTANYQFRSVYFVNQNTGWVVGWSGTVLKTTNRGVNWIYQTASGDFQSVFFINNNTGWLVGNSPIYKTTNGGNTWVAKLGTGPILLIVKFLDALNGYICGYGGAVLKTTNGGDSWVYKSTGVSYNLTGMDFVDKNNGWISGDNGTVKKTTDGGDNWITQNSGTTANIGKLDFVDHNNGWITAANGSILRTTNGGNNWILSQTPVTNWLSTVYFLDAYVGYAAGGVYYGGECDILKTINGGVTWYKMPVPANKWVALLFFVNPKVGWAVGNDGLILKYSYCVDESLDNPNNNSTSNNPSDFSLSQNYPNPFNPVTKIRFDVPQSSGETPVSIKVYDNLGREVSVIVDNIVAAGSHEVVFDGSKFSSGTYFYTITAGSFKATKSMTLIK